MESKQLVLLVFWLNCTCLLAQQINWNECGNSRGCFFSPKECNSETSCKYLLTYQEMESHISFEMSGSVDFPLESSYVAIAFSEDKRMGEDSVIECVHDISTGEVNLFPSYNTLGKNNDRINIPLEDAGLVLQNSSYYDGVIRCRFTREKVVDHDLIYDLNKQWYLLMANGQAKSSNIDQHLLDPLPVRSDDRVSVLGLAVGGGATSSSALAIAHGCLMLIAWVFFVSLGKITARYYKETWEEKVLDLAVWFQIHRTCMVTAWICFVIATILIIYQVSGWVSNRGDSFSHSIVGIIAVCLGILQPFIALCRCHPGSANRPWFNWIHWAIGTVAHILAVSAIFLAFAFMHAKNALPFYMFCIMGSYVIWHVFCEIVLEIHACCIYKKRKRAEEVTLRPVNQGAFTVAVERPRPPKGSGFQKFMLALYVIVLLILTIALVVLLIVKWGKSY